MFSAMALIHFTAPQGNKWNRINENLWNEYKEEIERQYRLGGKRGVARALRWIHDQNIPDFQPTCVFPLPDLQISIFVLKALTHFIRRRAVEYHLTKWGLKTSFNAMANPISSITSTNENMNHIQNQRNSTKFSKPSDYMLDSTFANLEVICGTQDIAKWPAMVDSTAAEHPTEYGSDSSPSSDANTPHSSPSNNANTSHSSPTTDANTSHSSPTRNVNTSDSTTPTTSSLGKRRGNSIENYIEPLEKRARHEEADQQQYLLDKDLDEWFPSYILYDVALVTEVARSFPASSLEEWLQAVEGAGKEVPYRKNLIQVQEFQSESGTAPCGDEIHQIPNPMVNQERMLEILEKIGVSWPTEDVQNLLDPNHSLPATANLRDDLQMIKMGADFLFGSSVLQDAFPLYLILGRLSNSSLGHLNFNTLLFCMRAAVLESDLKLLRALLRHKLSMFGEQPNKSFQQFLLSLALLRINEALKDKRAWKQDLRRVMLIFPNTNVLLDQYESQFGDTQRHIQLNLPNFVSVGRWITCECPVRVFQHDSNHFIQAGQYDRKFFHRLSKAFLGHSSGPFAIGNGCMKNSWLRSCLDWCRAQLESSSYSPQLHHRWNDLRSLTKQRDWAEAMAIYWFFFEQYRHAQQSIGTSEFWTDEREALLGISIEETFSALASLILKSWPWKERVRNGQQAKDLRDSELVERAVKGSLKLLQKNDGELVGSFVRHFIRTNHTLHPPNLSSEAEGYDQIVAGVFVNVVKGDHVSETSSSLQRESVATFTSADPTIATSHTSSDLSSMRRLTVETVRRSVQTVRESWIYDDRCFSRDPGWEDRLSDSLSQITVSGVEEMQPISEISFPGLGDTEMPNEYSVPSESLSWKTPTLEGFYYVDLAGLGYPSPPSSPLISSILRRAQARFRGSAHQPPTAATQLSQLQIYHCHNMRLHDLDGLPAGQHGNALGS